MEHVSNDKSTPESYQTDRVRDILGQCGASKTMIDGVVVSLAAYDNYWHEQDVFSDDTARGMSPYDLVTQIEQTAEILLADRQYPDIQPLEISLVTSINDEAFEAEKDEYANLSITYGCKTVLCPDYNGGITSDYVMSLNLDDIGELVTSYSDAAPPEDIDTIAAAAHLGLTCLLHGTLLRARLISETGFDKTKIWYKNNRRTLFGDSAVDRKAAMLSLQSLIASLEDTSEYATPEFCQKMSQELDVAIKAHDITCEFLKQVWYEYDDGQDTPVFIDKSYPDMPTKYKMAVENERQAHITRLLEMSEYFNSIYQISGGQIKKRGLKDLRQYLDGQYGDKKDGVIGLICALSEMKKNQLNEEIRARQTMIETSKNLNVKTPALFDLPGMLGDISDRKYWPGLKGALERYWPGGGGKAVAEHIATLLELNENEAPAQPAPAPNYFNNNTASHARPSRPNNNEYNWSQLHKEFLENPEKFGVKPVEPEIVDATLDGSDTEVKPATQFDEALEALKQADKLQAFEEKPEMPERSPAGLFSKNGEKSNKRFDQTRVDMMDLLSDSWLEEKHYFDRFKGDRGYIKLLLNHDDVGYLVIENENYGNRTFIFRTDICGYDFKELTKIIEGSKNAAKSVAGVSHIIHTKDFSADIHADKIITAILRLAQDFGETSNGHSYNNFNSNI